MFKMKLLIALWDMLECSYDILAINTFKLGFFFAYFDRKDIIFPRDQLKFIIFQVDPFAQALS